MYVATAVTGLPVLAARLVNVLLGALAVPILAVLLGRTFGRRPAILGALLAGASWALVLDSGTAMTEPLFLVISILLTGRCLAAWERRADRGGPTGRRLAAFPLPRQRVTFPVVVAWRRDAPVSPLLDALLECAPQPT